MKNVFKFLLLISLIPLYPFYIYTSRTFYSLGDQRSVTIWKNINSSCYVIPKKYYGFFPPNKGFIKINNSSDITFYWSEDLQDEVVFRTESKYELVDTEKLKITNYYDSTKYGSLKVFLYGNGDKKFDEVKSNVAFMSINIKENYAINKYGQKL